MISTPAVDLRELVAKVTSSMARKRVMADISIGGWVPRVTDKRVRDDLASANGADAKRVSVSKRLAEEAYKPVTAAKGVVRTEFYNHSQEWLGDGWRVMSIESYKEFAGLLPKLETEYMRAVDALCGQWESIKEADMASLGGLYNEGDYMAAEELRKRHYIKLRARPFATEANAALLDINKEEKEELAMQIQQDTEQLAHTIINDTVRRLHEPVVKMVETLRQFTETKGTDDQLRFTKTLVSNVEDAVREVSLLDADGIMDGVLDQVKSLTTFTSEELKENDGARAAVVEEADAIARKLQGYFV